VTMTLAMQRPALVESDEHRLDAEYRSARWAYHRLLDFEDQHQRVLDAAAEAAAPGIVRVGRILARLARRAKRRERTTEGQWSPSPRPDLAARLKALLPELREKRNADPRWAAACAWADEPIGEPKQLRRRRAKDPAKIKRRKTESDEAFAKRFALLTQDETDEHFAEKLAKSPRQTRRDVYRADLYKARRIYWGTWNALIRSVDQARQAVLKLRKQGLPAEWRRPRWSDDSSISADGGGFRVVDRSPLWWTIELRLGVTEEWVRFRAKCGNWHDVPEGAELRTCKLTRRRDGMRWRHSVSIVVDGAQKRPALTASCGTVALDWGHREHGHDHAREGLRVFTWTGDDGRSGEILLPTECRELLDQIDALKSQTDKAFDARKAAHGLLDRNRYTYRRRLMGSGVRTEEESLWLRWEMRYERRVARGRKRIQNLRRETYTVAIRELRQRYAIFAIEDEAAWSHKRQAKEEMSPRRKRSNRDMSARYEFVQLCERFGAELVPVTARNSTRECPDCGALAENGPELLVMCPGCGTVRDKDYGACRVILRRAQEALANREAAA
jgi:hypothetical protein